MVFMRLVMGLKPGHTCHAGQRYDTHTHTHINTDLEQILDFACFYSFSAVCLGSILRAVLPDKSDYDTMHINTGDTLCKYTGLSHQGGERPGKTRAGADFPRKSRRFSVTSHEHFSTFPSHSTLISFISPLIIFQRSMCLLQEHSR